PPGTGSPTWTSPAAARWWTTPSTSPRSSTRSSARPRPSTPPPTASSTPTARGRGPRPAAWSRSPTTRGRWPPSTAPGPCRTTPPPGAGCACRRSAPAGRCRSTPSPSTWAGPGAGCPTAATWTPCCSRPSSMRCGRAGPSTPPARWGGAPPAWSPRPGSPCPPGLGSARQVALEHGREAEGDQLAHRQRRVGADHALASQHQLVDPVEVVGVPAHAAHQDVVQTAQAVDLHHLGDLPQLPDHVL